MNLDEIQSLWEEDAKIEALLLKCDQEAEEHAEIFELDDKLKEAMWLSDK